MVCWLSVLLPVGVLLSKRHLWDAEGRQLVAWWFQLALLRLLVVHGFLYSALLQYSELSVAIK